MCYNLRIRVSATVLLLTKTSPYNILGCVSKRVIKRIINASAITLDIHLIKCSIGNSSLYACGTMNADKKYPYYALELALVVGSTDAAEVYENLCV